MILSHIVAVARNNAIGKENTLPWNLPEDMKHFRDTTKGKVMIMGRKTYDSLGRPLPGRFHIVVTRNPHKSENDSVVYVSSLDEAYKIARSLIPKWPEEVFIIGGAEIYKQTLPQTDRVYFTQIDKTVDADAFYPRVNWAEFDLKYQNHFETSEKFSISLYCRKV